MVLEPVATFLERLYADPQRYAFAFQLNMMQTRITSLLRSQMATEGTFVLDRSVFGDSVFAVRNFLDGNIDEREMDIYGEPRAHEYENLLPGPARMIYLDACPEVCHRRMVDVRQNEAEAGVPIEYLDGLDEVYVNAVLAQAARSDPAIDIVVMDASSGALIEGGRIHDIEELVLGEGSLDEARGWPRRSNVRLAQSSAEVGGGVLSSSSTAVYRSVEDCEASLEKLERQAARSRCSTGARWRKARCRARARRGWRAHPHSGGARSTSSAATTSGCAPPFTALSRAEPRVGARTRIMHART